MSKAELVEAIAEKAGFTKADAARAVDAFEESVIEGVKKHKSVTLVGFGKWESKERPARTGRNPQTGKPVQIAAKNAVTFKAGSKFKEAVN